MKRELRQQRVWTRILGSAAVGAAAMYALDPDKGRRRRALARDKARSLLLDTRDAFGVTRRDVTHRIQGLRARVRRLFRQRPSPDNLQLIERVRARMGRVVSHPHALQVGAHDGRVTLSGPILAREVHPLLESIRTVWGVFDIDDRLVVHDHPESIPSLQGGVERRRIHPEILQENWSPSLRAAAVLGGALLSICALRQRSFLGRAVLIGAGAGLAARGATNLPISRLARIGAGRRAIDLEKTLHLAAAPEAVYDLWTDWENLPRFMSHVRQVRDYGDGRTHWVVTGPDGTRLQWDAVVTRSTRPQLLAWQTDPESLVQHAGTVRFEPFGDGTRVSVKMTYNARGRVGRALAALLGRDPRQQMDDDLARMRTLVEQRKLPHDAALGDRGARAPLH